MDNMDNNNDIIELLDILYGMVTEAWGVPLGNDKCIIEREKAIEIINDIKANLPSALAEAKRLVSARDEFIGNAKREAEALRKSAEEKARAMVEEQEVVREARARSAEMIAAAEAKSNELRRLAGDYVDKIMRDSEESVSSALKLPCVLCQKSVRGIHSHVGVFSHCPLDHLRPFFDGEHGRGLGGVYHDAHHNPVKKLGGTADNIQVTQSDRIKASRADGGSHQRLSLVYKHSLTLPYTYSFLFLYGEVISGSALSRRASHNIIPPSDNMSTNLTVSSTDSYKFES